MSTELTRINLVNNTPRKYLCGCFATWPDIRRGVDSKTTMVACFSWEQPSFESLLSVHSAKQYASLRGKCPHLTVALTLREDSPESVLDVSLECAVKDDERTLPEACRRYAQQSDHAGCFMEVSRQNRMDFWLYLGFRDGLFGANMGRYCADAPTTDAVSKMIQHQRLSPRPWGRRWLLLPIPMCPITCLGSTSTQQRSSK